MEFVDLDMQVVVLAGLADGCHGFFDIAWRRRRAGCVGLLLHYTTRESPRNEK